MDRNELMRLYYEADNGPKRDAIQKRLMLFDKKTADEADVLGQLSYPQRKLKEAWSGDEQEWFSPEGMDPRLYAAGNVALDLVADPLNLIGGGLWTKGARGAKAAYGSLKDASKGMLTANADNYLPSFYRPDADAALTPMQNLVNNAQMDGLTYGVDPATAALRIREGQGDIRGASQKLGSTLSSVVQGGRDAFINMLSPSARALWREKGISYGGQRIIDNHLKRHDELTNAINKLRELPEGTEGRAAAIKELVEQRTKERSIAKAGAETIYQSHNATQAGRVGGKADALADFETRVFEELPQPNDKGTISGIAQRHSPQKNVNGKWVDDPVSETDAAYIEQHVNKRWPGTADVVVKTPEKEASGKHYMDLVGMKSPNMMFFKRLFKADKPPAGKSWADHVEEQATEWNKNAKYRVIVHRNGDDVWVESSRPGSAIVEGGYNGLHKIEPDGNFIATMSDEHNFLENIPGLGKVVQKLLPRNLVAITPPIRGNVLEKGTHRTAATANRLAKPNKKKDPSVPMGTGRPEIIQNLYDVAKETASDAAIRAERQRTAGMLSSLATPTSKLTSNEEE